MSWSLENAWMLGWAAAAAIPLLLYLLRRRQIITVPWAATEFLRESVAARSRRFNWKHLILLILRMMIPVLVAICAAMPFIKTDTQHTNQRQTRRHLILVIDTSMSMAYQIQNETVLDIARDHALNLVDQVGENDAVTIVSVGSNEPDVLIRHSTNRSIEKQLIGSMPQQYGMLNLLPALNTVNSILSDKASRNYEKSQVVLVSDNAGPSWQFREDSIIESMSQISDVASVSIIECGESIRDNTAVTRLASSTERITTGQTMTIQVEVTGFDLMSPRSVRTELLVNEQPWDEKTIAVPVDGATSVTFQYQPAESGDYVFQAKIEADNLVADDQRWFSVSAVPQIRLLCIEGDKGSARSVVAATENFPGTNLPEIRSEVTIQDALTDAMLRDTDFACFCDVRPLSALQASAVSEFMVQGGCALLCLGPGSDEGWLNQFLNSVLGDSNTIEIGEANPRGDFRLDPLEYEHPAIKAFENHWRAGLIDAPVWQFKLARVDTDRVEPVLQFDDGSPALFTTAVGRGRLIVCTTPLGFSSASTLTDGSRWNALDAWWSFVPLISELIGWGHGATRAGRNLQIGDHLIHPVFESNLRQEYSVFSPDGEMTVREPSNSRPPVVEFGPLPKPGVYQIMPNGSPNDVQSYSVNVNANESNLRRLARDPDSPFVDHLNKSDVIRYGDESSSSRMPFVIALTILLAAMVGEVLVAHWFGYRTKARA